MYSFWAGGSAAAESLGASNDRRRLERFVRFFFVFCSINQIFLDGFEIPGNCGGLRNTSVEIFMFVDVLSEWGKNSFRAVLVVQTVFKSI